MSNSDKGNSGYDYCREGAIIIPGLLVGSQEMAENLALLRKFKVTHILNVATGVVNLYPNEFEYKTLPIFDFPDFPINEFFESSIEFIKSGIEYGTVLVHCNAGVSRSVTIVVAFLMHTLGMSLDDALFLVKSNRPTSSPNAGFMMQLRNYESQLKQK